MRCGSTSTLTGHGAAQAQAALRFRRWCFEPPAGTTLGHTRGIGGLQRTRPASFHCVVPPMPTGVSEKLVPLRSVGEAGPSRPATLTPREGITCSPAAAFRARLALYDTQSATPALLGALFVPQCCIII